MNKKLSILGFLEIFWITNETALPSIFRFLLVTCSHVRQKIVTELVVSEAAIMFFKISILKIFATFTGKHLCWNFFFIKLRALGL